MSTPEPKRLHPNLFVLDFDAARDSNAQDALGELTAPFMLSILNASPDCIKIVELDGRVSFMNHNGMCAMEIDDFSRIAGKQWCDLWPDASQHLISEAVDAAREGKATRFEALCPTAKGQPRWWDVSVAPVVNASGKVERVLSISRDVTHQIEREGRLQDHDVQLKRLAEQQARDLREKERLLEVQGTLMREIDHRVKNSLAMISGLLRMQANAITDEAAKAELVDAANRVITVGRVHGRLYQGADVGSVTLSDYLQPLCVEICNAIAGPDIKLTVNVEPITLSADKAVAIGLIASELLTNAVRHAFPDRKGEVRISCIADDAERRMLVVEDDGTGIPQGFDPETCGGLGMKIVNLYAQRLNASFCCGRRDAGGSRFALQF